MPKKLLNTPMILALVLVTAAFVNAQSSPDGVWTQVSDAGLAGRTGERLIVPNAYGTFSLNKSAVNAILNSAPEEFSDTSRFVQTILTLPMPDGKFERFRIEHSLIVEPGLLEKFPELGRTYNGRGIDNPHATVRLDFMPQGFHAMILSERPTVYIDPYAKGDTDHYISYQKTSLPRERGNYCGLETENPDVFGILNKSDDVSRGAFTDSVINGEQLRTYRLALAATFEYTAFFGTGAASIAAMTTSMNRVNGVYEKDLAIRMVLIANNNLLVYSGDSTNCGGVACTSGNDPYTNSNGSTMLGQNQSNLDTVIGTANYDVGHVFSTGGGGVATLNGPCNAGSKARGVTGLGNPTGDGFDIDFVAHEMGHQFGALHTFNGSIGNCSGGNRSASAAYEPGSGITIMAYAGICGSDDLAAHSIDTFHVKSLEQIVAFREAGGACGPATATGNTPPTVSVVGGPTFNIPKSTPFTLTATASDINAGDAITYDWEEYDLGPAGPPHTDADGQARPLFRPYLPLTTGSRTYPSLNFILDNANVPPGTTGGFLTGEILPSITRTMTFQVVARDNRASGGGINTATATVNVDGVSGPFAVTAPNTGVTYAGNSNQNITWSVAGTSGAPVNAANVKISFSTDGGLTFPTTLVASTPNDGSQLVTIPVGNTTTARIKVEAVGNIFFDVSNVNFTVNGIAGPPRSRADFDGDGKTDLSVFRPSEGNWYLNRSTAGFSVVRWGLAGDVLAPGDYDNDGKTDVAVFRGTAGPGADFYILNSGTSTITFGEWGTTGDVPVVGDYDGDGKSDIAVFRPSTGSWWIVKSAGGTTIVPFGFSTDLPIVGDFDGDGKVDISIYRPSSGQWLGTFSSGGSINIVLGGATGDRPVPADYDGDSKDDFAVYRTSGTWQIYQSNSGTILNVPFGISTDIPVPGDYDGDGRDDQAIYRNGTWWLNQSFSGVSTAAFGLSSDIAVPAEYVP